MANIPFSIQYAGLTLWISQNSQGQEVTPLKPITDLFGLEWKRQQKKVTRSAHHKSRFGVTVISLLAQDGQNREQTCILLSRVSSFLMSISFEHVRSAGNHDGAAFLAAKQKEWDALIEKMVGELGLPYQREIPA